MGHGMVEQMVSRDLIESSCPVSVDLAVFTLAGRELSVLLRERTEPPYPGFWALPGGLRCPGTSLDAQAPALQLGITAVEDGWIEQLKTFHRPNPTDPSARMVVPGRRPRGDVSPVAYIAL